MKKPRFFSSKHSHFFSRMLLISTVLLTVFSFSVSIFISQLSIRYERSQYLKPYDLAAANLSEAFSNHFDNFYILAGKVLSGNRCDPNLCKLLEASSYDDVSAATRNSCIRLLTDICNDDRYLRGFLIYSPATEQLYYFSDTQAYLAPAEHVTDMKPITPFSRNTFSLDEVSRMIYACTGNAFVQHTYYGLTATIYRTADAPLGYLIPLYSVAEYNSILANYEFTTNCTFRISDPEGNLFFNSSPALDVSSGNYYQDTLKIENGKFLLTYYTEEYQPAFPSLSRLSILLALLLTVFSFGLYYLTYYLSNRNIHVILDGMKKFQLNDLTYRIDSLPGHNEFTEIIEGFNAMCNELQQNVEKSYVYELQQKRSDLYALQTSINPHFLYNTLEMIRAQVLNGKNSDASQMILLLSKIYRSQINGSMFATLEQEEELCENLMILYQYRFQNFEYEFDLDDSVSHFALPKNTLQPLIENYFVHGIVSERQDNLIILSVTSFLEENRRYIRLSLANNGKPISPQRQADIEQKLQQNLYNENDAVGFALTNVNSRLRIVFHNDCSIHITSGGDDMSFRIDLRFPAMTAEQLKEPFQ
ncbi:MAG: histidine kinase [Lachnospiraceae bacterium]|nr:histidine kinase [Lachnospiraceae bacterium]